MKIKYMLMASVKKRLADAGYSPFIANELNSWELRKLLFCPKDSLKRLVKEVQNK
jgi:hypothetical protein